MTKRATKRKRLETAPARGSWRARLAVACAGRGPSILSRLLILVVLGWWSTAPGWHGGWIVDDDFYLTHNPLLNDPARLWKAWFQPGSFVEYYPIEQTVQWWEWQLWHNQTLGYHVANVVLHLLNAGLVWRLLAKFHLRWAWIGGLIFAVHPTTVESVVWISELKNTLSLAPFLLAMCAYVDYEEKGKSGDYYRALGWFVTAMLCKISMAPFPVILLLFAWWKRGKCGWTEIKESAPFFVVSVILGLTSLWSGAHYARLHLLPDPVTPIGGFWSRVALAGLSAAFYFSKAVLPLELSFSYPQWKVNPPELPQFLPWLVLAGVLAGLWRLRKTWGRHVLLGLGFFFAMLAPFVGFNETSYMQFTWVMDHFLYIPVVGVIGLAIAGLEGLRKYLSSSAQNYVWLPCVFGALILAGISHSYAASFTSQEALWAHALERNPNSAVARNNFGTALLLEGQRERAIRLYQEAVQLKPGFAVPHYDLGVAYAQAEAFPEADREFTEALRLNPKFTEAHFNFGNTLLKEGKTTEALDQFQQAIAIDPQFAEPHNNLGNVLLELGRIPEAEKEFEEALRINPDHIDALYNLGNALAQSGKVEEAKSRYERVLELNPADANARINLGTALLATGHIDDAVAQYKAGLQINPNSAEAHSDLGTALIQEGQESAAQAEYEEALRIDPKNADARQNLQRLKVLQDSRPSSP